jgi:probable HAF family extracellular repeat protein
VGFYRNSSFHGFLLSGGKYTNIDVPNAAFAFATGIDDAGRIVGFYADSSGYHGFLLSGRKYTTLDDPNADSGTLATGINDRGQIVGWYADASPVKAHGFLLSHGQYTTLDDPNAGSVTIANGINDHGQIVGGYFAANFSGEHGFLLSSGQSAVGAECCGQFDVRGDQMASAILLHILATSAQCGHNTTDAEGCRRPRKRP